MNIGSNRYLADTQQKHSAKGIGTNLFMFEKKFSLFYEKDSVDSSYIQDFNDEQFFVRDLLPQSPETLLSSKRDVYNILKHYLVMLKIALKVINIIEEKKYHEIDPQVGENQCQFRAYLFICLINGHPDLKSAKLTIDNKLVNKIKNLILIVEKKLEQLENGRQIKTVNRNYKISIKNLIIEYDLDINTNSVFYFFCECYMLTIYAEKNSEGMYIGIKYREMMEDNCISKTAAKNIIQKFQREVSYVSCQFVNLILKKMKKNKLNSSLFLETPKYDEEKRCCLPIFMASKVLLQDIIKNEYYVCLEIKYKNSKKINYLFFIGKNDSLQEIEPYKIEYKNNNFCIAFRCSTSFKSSKNNLKNISNYISCLKLENIILANWAVHPQYPGKKLSEFKNTHLGYQKNIDFDDFFLEYGKLKEFQSIKILSKKYNTKIFIEHVNIQNLRSLFLSQNLLEIDYQFQSKKLLESETFF